MNANYIVNIRTWFRYMDTAYRVSRYVGTNWTPGTGESALPNGFIGLSTYSHEPYVWTETVEGSEYDTDLLRLLGAK